MDTISHKTNQNTRLKNSKIHRSQQAISRKIIAFQELINLEKRKKSEREASFILEIPNSTMQSWRDKGSSLNQSHELAEFFSTPCGAIFLHRIVMSAYHVMHFGCGGIRSVQEFLELSQLTPFVASSLGALQSFSVRYEEHVIAFGNAQEPKLAKQMKKRKITAGLDELYRSRHPCLVAIDVVSGFILLEKFTVDRTVTTWNQELQPRLSQLNVELEQVVSDLCGSLRSYAKDAKATHIPDLFHAQYEISKATAAPLASQEKAFETALAKAENKLKRIEKKYGACSEKANDARMLRNCKKIGLDARKERKKKVQEAKKALGKIHHPIDLKTGKLQTPEKIKNEFDMQLKTIENAAKEAELSGSSLNRLKKSRRAFDAIMCFVSYFFVFYKAFLNGLKLENTQEGFFNEVVFPLSYLKMIWRRLNKKEKEELTPLKMSLELIFQNTSYCAELKQQWLKYGQECAERFQRSSSCVEGQNGLLSLYHHRFHRLNRRSLEALMVIQNFHRRRQDGTTAAERFFGCKHDELFEFLLENVRIPGKPKRQDHEATTHAIVRQKKRAA